MSLINKFRKSFLYKVYLTVFPMAIRRRIGLLKNDFVATVCKIPLIGKWVWKAKVAQLEKRPTQINIELTSICNAKCIMCPRHLMERKMEVMPFPLFEKIIQDAKAIGTTEFALNGYGEIFTARKDYQKYVGYLFQEIPHAKVLVNTNGSLMNEEAAHFLIDMKVDTVHIDIDGATKETFELVREHLKFEDVVNNVRRLKEIRTERKSLLPKIRVGMITQPENEHELKDHHKMWTGVADTVASDFFVSRLGYLEVDEIKLDKACFFLWEVMSIWSNGDAVICCDDWDGIEVMGNFNEQSLLEIWNDKKYLAYRELHLKGEIRKIKACSKCDFARPGPTWFQAQRIPKKAG